MAGDEVYGSDPKPARTVEGVGLGYAVAIASITIVNLNSVRRQRVGDIAAALPDSAWEERSAGAGAHG